MNRRYSRVFSHGKLFLVSALSLGLAIFGSNAFAQATGPQPDIPDGAFDGAEQPEGATSTFTPSSIDTTGMVSPAFGPAVHVFTNEYDAFGVHFSAGPPAPNTDTAVYNDPPLAWAGVNGTGDVDLLSDVDAQIVLPGTGGTPGQVDTLSVEMGISDVGALLLEAFDCEGNALPSTVNDDGQGPNGRTLATLNVPGISSFRVSTTQSDTFGVPSIELGEPQPCPERDTANFFVSKDFDDNNTAEVEVTLSCNTGLPLEQTTTISEGDPVNFVVGDFESGTLDCEVTEVVPVGYTASYNDASVDTVNCSWDDLVSGSTLGCIITNSLNEVEVEVTKVWIDENPQFNAVNIAEAEWECTNVSGGGTDDGRLDFFADPDIAFDEFFVLPDWESGTTCSVTEVNLFESGVEVDDSDCQGLVVFPGAGASCTIFNTRLFEGIPTLSQYGLGLLALLMLGMGFVAFRRVI